MAKKQLLESDKVTKHIDEIRERLRNDFVVTICELEKLLEQAKHDLNSTWLEETRFNVRRCYPDDGFLRGVIHLFNEPLPFDKTLAEKETNG